MFWIVRMKNIFLSMGFAWLQSLATAWARHQYTDYDNTFIIIIIIIIMNYYYYYEICEQTMTQQV